MKHPALLLSISVGLALALAHNAHAREREKGMQPAISKRGRLLFEDDFSGKKLEWAVDSGEWCIHKKAMVTKSREPSRTLGTARGRDSAEIWHWFDGVPDVIFEFRVILPTEGHCFVGSRFECGRAFPQALLAPQAGMMEIVCGQGQKNTHPLHYNKPVWLNVMLEMIGGRYALTVDSTTIEIEAIGVERVTRDRICIRTETRGGLLAVDDVKVWEALPKDEEDEKDKKKK